MTPPAQKKRCSIDRVVSVFVGIHKEGQARRQMKVIDLSF